METENIVNFLEVAYTDEKLSALLAHAQDGKLGYGSCCCLIGIPTADHALQEAPGCQQLAARGVNIDHYPTQGGPRRSELMDAAEAEFKMIGCEAGDQARRDAIVPLILAEMERREKARIVNEVAQAVAVL